MGSLAAIAKTFDGSGETLEAQKEVVNTLSELANKRLDVFELAISKSYLTAGSSENPTFPIKAVNMTWKKTHAITSQSTSELATKLREATKSFFSGGSEGIANGILTIVDGALDALFVNSTGSENKEELYFVYCKNGTVRRIDMAAWYRTVTATAIQTKMQKTSCFILQEATINCKEVDYYSFIGIVRDSYKELHLTQEEYDAAVAAAERDYVRGGGTIPPAADATKARSISFDDLQRQYRSSMTTRPLADDHVDLGSRIG